MEPYEILEEDEQLRDGNGVQDDASQSEACEGSSSANADAGHHIVPFGVGESDEIAPPYSASQDSRRSLGSEGSSSKGGDQNESAPSSIQYNSTKSPLVCGDDSEDESDDRDTQPLSVKMDRESKGTHTFVFLQKTAVEYGFGVSSSDPSSADRAEDVLVTTPRNSNAGIPEESRLAEEGEALTPSVEEDSSLFEKENQAFIPEAVESGILKRRLDKPGIFSDQLSGKEVLPLKKSQGVREKDKVPLLLPSPAKTDVSSEEDSTMMSTSIELDSLRSPGVASDGEGEDQGVCSKYSQLSEDGSSPSSNLKTEIDHAGQGNDSVVFEHSLELGVAFSDYVDVDDFKASLGSKNPHTEDGFGGKSEEHLLVLLKAGSHKNLKTYLRQCDWPPESDTRHRLWENLCVHLLKAGGNLYEDLAQERYGKDNGEEDLTLPSFVDPRHTHHHHLKKDGIAATKKIMGVIGHFDPDVLYCPLLYPLSCVFLHYMGSNSCFNCMQALLRSADPTYISQTKSTNDAVVYVLRDLAKKYTKQAYTLIVRSSKVPESVFENWIYWLFRDLPFQYLVRIIDCFLLEGYKVFYRTVLAIIHLFAKDMSKKGSRSSPVTNISAAISRFCTSMPIEPKKLLKVGFRIRGLTRKEIVKLQVKHQTFVKNQPNKEEMPMISSMSSATQMGLGRSLSGPVVLQYCGGSILSQDMLQTLWSWIPHRLTLKRLVQLYTSEEHGTSLRTLFVKCEHAQQTILVIKSTDDEIFGAFCSASWFERHEKNKPNSSFFGNGETFVFTLVPNEMKYAWAGLNPSQDSHNVADYFMAGDDSRLVVGSGSGQAIELDGMMGHCRTSRCDTFDNEPLSCSEDFSCRVVEVFGFVD